MQPISYSLLDSGPVLSSGLFVFPLFYSALAQQSSWPIQPFSLAQPSSTCPLPRCRHAAAAMLSSATDAMRREDKLLHHPSTSLHQTGTWPSPLPLCFPFVEII
jgi:hypothetical protein